ncbi:DUF1592 domain-containing protein [Flexithrix dorotheae]|uniref:DUF1592 domain-containing protein n=1 Tax=Flexithrix dorotheae TaxID=70993 RepID=UPI00039C71BB|nr:DUF1592 domain-containing protein [Flexithrix dorotheae]
MGQTTIFHFTIYMKLKSFYLFSILAILTFASKAQDSLFEKGLRPLLEKNCIECHNTGNVKGGINLDNFKEEGRVISRGRLWLKVLDQIKTREMPPDIRPRLTDQEYDSLTNGLSLILQKALANQNPGLITIRRLSHWEYHYAVKDLFGVDFDAKGYFPGDGSGGGGFDNQGKALFFTPLKFERYYDAAQTIVNDLSQNQELWEKVVPFEYKLTWWQQFSDWFKSIFSDSFQPSNPPELAAESVILPMAAKTYRRYLAKEEKANLMDFFGEVYHSMDSVPNPTRFNKSLEEVFKLLLVSPNFLYKQEEEPQVEHPIPLNDFELASRLSFFLWSSVPDEELYQLARTEQLSDTLVLEEQVKRMLADPKSKRFAEIFSSQWLGIDKLTDKGPVVDPEKYPEFTTSLRHNMYKETVEYFYYVLTQSKNLLDLINSDYTFLNQELAAFYNIDGVKGKEFQKVGLIDKSRGGILGMGSVLTVTSLPLRTSPVLRGKWVLEEILGTSPPPPPPDAGELPEDEALHEDLGLRGLLEMHRSKPGCQSCHEKMDPLGLGLENFDLIGRWRDSYGKVPIDASGVLANGEVFNGPAELKELLLMEERKFARNISNRLLSYALGRSILFTDEPMLRKMEASLLENNFNPDNVIVELVKGYVFRLKIKDFQKKSNEI